MEIKWLDEVTNLSFQLACVSCPVGMGCQSFLCLSPHIQSKAGAGVKLPLLQTSRELPSCFTLLKRRPFVCLLLVLNIWN